MKYLVHWNMGNEDYRDYKGSLELTQDQLKDLIQRLSSKEQVVYINNGITNGRILVWGLDNVNLTLELQYTDHCFSKDIKKSEFEKVLLKIPEIEKAPKDYDFKYEV
ncbi:MAG: hypothetical protein OEZ58_11455 [Gammaproteobacteria bacterium]|nr:hypothetical protein [Gammaproteobacteria bacterium]